MSMDEVLPGLWIGDLPSALSVENLKSQGIYSILSAMRGRLTIQETFIKHQVLLDDTEDEDILRHLLPSIHFIQAELDKGRGVLVHCHAGVSRSATVVAAYLMYTKDLDTEAALEMIRNVRPYIEPNQNFLRQLEIFHQAHFKISRKDKSTRLYYMERALDEVMNGDGSPPETDMFAKFPHTPSDSAPNTPGAPRRRIRCKMCRHELATREHMLDHGQLSPATPAAMTPAASRRPSSRSSRPSMSQARPNIATISEAQPRRLSLLSFGDSLAMSSIDSETTGPTDAQTPVVRARRLSPGERPLIRDSPEALQEGRDPSQSTSALESDEEEPPPPSEKRTLSGFVASPSGMSHEAAKIIGRRMSDAVLSPLTEPKESPLETITNARRASDDGHQPSSSSTVDKTIMTTFINPSDLAAELQGNPKLAALRPQSGMGTSSAQAPLKAATPFMPPIIANPKCSGYFVEPMKWMDPFLSSGQLAGKIVCPNVKCGAKLGNFDWAGVCCGCKAWVTPGFCINRSKVDEIVK